MFRKKLHLTEGPITWQISALAEKWTENSTKVDMVCFSPVGYGV